MQKRSFYQDRLGTNTGKTPKKRPFFLRLTTPVGRRDGATGRISGGEAAGTFNNALLVLLYFNVILGGLRMDGPAT